MYILTYSLEEIYNNPITTVLAVSSSIEALIALAEEDAGQKLTWDVDASGEACEAKVEVYSDYAIGVYDIQPVKVV